MLFSVADFLRLLTITSISISNRGFCHGGSNYTHLVGYEWEKCRIPPVCMYNRVLMYYIIKKYFDSSMNTYSYTAAHTHRASLELLPLVPPLPGMESWERGLAWTPA